MHLAAKRVGRGLLPGASGQGCDDLLLVVHQHAAGEHPRLPGDSTDARAVLGSTDVGLVGRRAQHQDPIGIADLAVHELRD